MHTNFGESVGGGIKKKELALKRSSRERAREEKLGNMSESTQQRELFLLQQPAQKNTSNLGWQQPTHKRSILHVDINCIWLIRLQDISTKYKK